MEAIMIGNEIEYQWNAFHYAIIMLNHLSTKCPHCGNRLEVKIRERLTDVDHPDHTLITYPGLGHDLSPAIGVYSGSSMYGLVSASGPIIDYVLADLYAWLESHSGFTHIAAPISSSNVSSSSPTTR